jgi:hypothetical protein
MSLTKIKEMIHKYYTDLIHIKQFKFIKFSSHHCIKHQLV